VFIHRLNHVLWLLLLGAVWRRDGLPQAALRRHDKAALVTARAPVSGCRHWHALCACWWMDPSTPPGPAGQLGLLLQSTGEGIFGVDMAGHCTFINRAGAEMLGRRTEVVLGRNMRGLMHRSDADGSNCPEAACPTASTARWPAS